MAGCDVGAYAPATRSWIAIGKISGRGKLQIAVASILRSDGGRGCSVDTIDIVPLRLGTNLKRHPTGTPSMPQLTLCRPSHMSGAEAAMMSASGHIAKSFCNAKPGRYRGMADIEQASPRSIWLKLPTSVRSNPSRRCRARWRKATSRERARRSPRPQPPSARCARRVGSKKALRHG